MSNISGPSYLIIGHRHGLGPALHASLNKLGDCSYHEASTEFILEDLDHLLGAETVLIYAHVLLNTDRFYKETAASHNVKMSEELADALHGQPYKKLYFISHYLAPSMQQIQEASTRHEDPIALVQGLEKVERRIHRLSAEGHPVHIIRLPFLGRRPKSSSPTNSYQVIPIEDAVKQIMHIILTPQDKVVISCTGLDTADVSDLNELNNSTSSLPSVNLWKQLSGFFTSSDILPH